MAAPAAIVDLDVRFTDAPTCSARCCTHAQAAIHLAEVQASRSRIR